MAISEKIGIDVGRVILLWNIAKGYAVIPKSTNEQRIASNIQLEGASLTEDEISLIDEIGKN